MTANTGAPAGWEPGGTCTCGHGFVTHPAVANSPCSITDCQCERFLLRSANPPAPAPA